MKKKYLIYFITFIFAFIATINISIGIYARQNVKYEIEVNNDVKIDNVVINNTTIPLTRYLGENLLIDEEKNLSATKSSTVTIVASKVDDISITFKTDDSNKINVLKDSKKQTVDKLVYANKTSMFDISVTSIKYVGGFVFLIFAVCYVVLFGCLYFFKKVLLKLKDNSVKLRDIILLTTCVFLIYFSTFYILLSIFRVAVLVPIIIAIIAGIYFLKDTLKDNLQNVYAYIAVIAGISMLFIIPPFNVPDEGAHYRRSFIETEARSREDNGRTNFPVSVENFMYKYIHGSQVLDTTYSGKNYFSDMFESGDYDKLYPEIRSYTNTKYLSTFTYIPSIIALFIGKLLKFSPLMLLLFGRFIDFLVVILSCYVAIKYIPCFKKLVFCITLFPMFLHQAAAINQDFMTNAITLLSVTYILRLVYEKEKITIKDNIITLLLAILVGVCKFGYFPIFLLLLLVPREKFESKKVANIMLVLPVIIAFVISFYINRGSANIKNSPYYTIGEALSNPFNTIKIFFNTALDRFSLDIFRGLFDGFGISTKWHYNLLLFILTIVYSFLLFTSNDEDKKLNKKERIIYLGTSFVIMLILYASLFIGWTFKGAKTIDGLQPRYFIPAAYLFYIGLSNKKVNLMVKNKELFYAYGVSIVYLISFATILLGFY